MSGGLTNREDPHHSAALTECFRPFRKFLHDPEIYVDPLTFDPSRFIDSDGHIPERDPADFVFGFGRRCGVVRFVSFQSY